MVWSKNLKKRNGHFQFCLTVTASQESFLWKDVTRMKRKYCIYKKWGLWGFPKGSHGIYLLVTDWLHPKRLSFWSELNDHWPYYVCTQYTVHCS